MRRHISPFNGNRYVLNKNTCEVHDLDRETQSCKIDAISASHVYNCESYEVAQAYSTMILGKPCNGCAYCMPEKNNG